MLVVAALLLFTPSLGRGVHARSPPRLMPTVAGGPALPIGGGGSLPRPSPPPLQPANGTSYDEQLGITFAQSFTSILYNVTFVEQADNVSGSGPAYLLNGLSDAGYWYQVGVSWNWVPGQGVGFSYEVFGANGTSVYPSGGGAGLGIFSGPVASGDRVALNLYFSGKNVEMVAEDLNTSASASTSYSSEGGSSFVGLTGPGNQNGFFTGLMTEWYHPQPYYGDEQGVTYVTSSPLTSAWMWIDEVGCPDFQCSSPSLLFSARKGPILYSNPTEFV
ncbi:MAG TPA: hypothetical protein VJR06_08210, partial [Nitrososphaerales archaeon]|nr:hypothetical protein [Nitrososphaerales archaeon]